MPPCVGAFTGHSQLSCELAWGKTACVWVIVISSLFQSTRFAVVLSLSQTGPPLAGEQDQHHQGVSSMVEEPGQPQWLGSPAMCSCLLCIMFMIYAEANTLIMNPFLSLQRGKLSATISLATTPVESVAQLDQQQEAATAEAKPHSACEDPDNPLGADETGVDAHAPAQRRGAPAIADWCRPPRPQTGCGSGKPLGRGVPSGSKDNGCVFQYAASCWFEFKHRVLIQRSMEILPAALSAFTCSIVIRTFLSDGTPPDIFYAQEAEAAISSASDQADRRVLDIGSGYSASASPFHFLTSEGPDLASSANSSVTSLPGGHPHLYTLLAASSREALLDTWVLWGLWLMFIFNGGLLALGPPAVAPYWLETFSAKQVQHRQGKRGRTNIAQRVMRTIASCTDLHMCAAAWGGGTNCVLVLMSMLMSRPCSTNSSQPQSQQQCAHSRSVGGLTLLCCAAPYICMMIQGLMKSPSAWWIFDSKKIVLDKKQSLSAPSADCACGQGYGSSSSSSSMGSDDDDDDEKRFYPRNKITDRLPKQSPSCGNPGQSLSPQQRRLPDTEPPPLPIWTTGDLTHTTERATQRRRRRRSSSGSTSQTFPSLANRGGWGAFQPTSYPTIPACWTIIAVILYSNVGLLVSIHYSSRWVAQAAWVTLNHFFLVGIQVCHILHSQGQGHRSMQRGLAAIAALSCMFLLSSGSQFRPPALSSPLPLPKQQAGSGDLQEWSQGHEGSAYTYNNTVWLQTRRLVAQNTGLIRPAGFFQEGVTIQPPDQTYNLGAMPELLRSPSVSTPPPPYQLRSTEASPEIVPRTHPWPSVPFVTARLANSSASQDEADSNSANTPPTPDAEQEDSRDQQQKPPFSPAALLAQALFVWATAGITRALLRGLFGDYQPNRYEGYERRHSKPSSEHHGQPQLSQGATKNVKNNAPSPSAPAHLLCSSLPTPGCCCTVRSLEKTMQDSSAHILAMHGFFSKAFLSLASAAVGELIVVYRESRGAERQGTEGGTAGPVLEVSGEMKEAVVWITSIVATTAVLSACMAEYAITRRVWSWAWPYVTSAAPVCWASIKKTFGCFCWCCGAGPLPGRSRKKKKLLTALCCVAKNILVPCVSAFACLCWCCCLKQVRMGRGGIRRRRGGEDPDLQLVDLVDGPSGDEAAAWDPDATSVPPPTSSSSHHCSCPPAFPQPCLVAPQRQHTHTDHAGAAQVECYRQEKLGSIQALQGGAFLEYLEGTPPRDAESPAQQDQQLRAHQDSSVGELRKVCSCCALASVLQS